MELWEMSMGENCRIWECEWNKTCGWMNDKNRLFQDRVQWDCVSCAGVKQEEKVGSWREKVVDVPWTRYSSRGSIISMDVLSLVIPWMPVCNLLISLILWSAAITPSSMDNQNEHTSFKSYLLINTAYGEVSFLSKPAWSWSIGWSDYWCKHKSHVRGAWEGAL